MDWKSRFIITIIMVSTFLYYPTMQVGAQDYQKIVKRIESTQQAILKKAGPNASKKFVFVAFWDFDGTILKGDCSEGFISKDKDTKGYPGLAQLTIEAGFSKTYAPKDGFIQFSKDYDYMLKHVGKWMAYPYIPQMLRGASLSKVEVLSKNHFERVMRHYYYDYSVKILQSLEKKNINNYIISASADMFVDGAASTLKLTRDRFYGIQVRIKNDSITEELIYPVTYAEGKSVKLCSILYKIRAEHPGKNVIVLAAFGNSYSTDGPFMKYVADQTLPAAEPVVVMINGGKAPNKYQDLFTCVQLSETVK